jgi:hypothetical protein
VRLIGISNPVLTVIAWGGKSCVTLRPFLPPRPNGAHMKLTADFSMPVHKALSDGVPRLLVGGTWLRIKLYVGQ